MSLQFTWVLKYSLKTGYFNVYPGIVISTSPFLSSSYMFKRKNAMKIFFFIFNVFVTKLKYL